MIFPGMSEYQFATFIVVVKQEQIKKDLKIKMLYMETVIKTVSEFISKNKEFIQTQYKNQYACLDDENFYFNVINFLQKAKANGTNLEITIH